MPNESLLEKQQAAYVAATLMDDGMSPRAASKVADYSRKQSIDLATRREQSNLPTHTQQVILEYLRATIEHGSGPEARTTEAVIAAFPFAEPERLNADLNALKQGGWRETNAYASGRKPSPAGTNLPWKQPDLYQQYQQYRKEQEQLQMEQTLPPPDQRAGTDYLKEAALYHWTTRKPRTNYDNYIGLNEWPGRRPTIITILSDMMGEYEDLDEGDPYLELMNKVGDAAEFILPFATEPNTTRILCNIDNSVDQGQPPTSHSPWPSHGAIYAELETPLTIDGVTLHGLATLPEPKDPDPETWLVGLLCQQGEDIYMPVASIRPDTGETECPVTAEHECALDTELHLKITAAVAHAVSGPLEPEHMNRQQRRHLKRKGWPNLWLIAGNATGKPHQ